jgi:hypothetical protein
VTCSSAAVMQGRQLGARRLGFIGTGSSTHRFCETEHEMATVRTHRYKLAPDIVEKFLAQRADLIGKWRAAGFDLVETRLYRLEDGTYLDIWRWASDDTMAKAFAAMSELPLARETLVMTGDRLATDGELVDER